jgi:hypothetical protein
MSEKNKPKKVKLVRAGMYAILFLVMGCSSRGLVSRSPDGYRGSATREERQQRRWSDGASEKITFDIEAIDEHGLLGEADGKRSVAYEFCIPRDSGKRTEVSRIDPSVNFFAGPSGRVGCDTTQYLCIGEGATRAVLLRLARLDYVKKIGPFYGE